ncbi:MAG: RNA polymerase sigma factor [Saprospirales bacterium]|nr:MAG: RNA polymerase sigma factor [Saprospirales bacterium]
MKDNSTISEEELLEGCRKNKRDLQEVFYKRHFDMMYGIAKSRIHDPEEAMMVVNNAFLRAFKKIDLYHAYGSLGAWLRRLLFNAIADYYRSRSNGKKSSEVVEHVNQRLILNPQALSDLYYKDLIDMVRQLPDITRDVFTLFAIEGFSHSDIAELLDIPEGSSKWQLHQARKILKAKLAQRDEMDRKLKII